MTFDVALELAGGKGPLGRERWEELVECLGREGALVLALVQVCGLYWYTCLLLDGCGVSLPEDERIWE